MTTKERMFHLGENARMAMETLRAHKTRSLLTVLGVVIAVVVLILVFAVMYGVDADMRAYLEDYGTNTLFIYKFDTNFRSSRPSQAERTRKPLTLDDGKAIEEGAPSVKAVNVEAIPWNPARNGPPTSLPTARYGTKEVLQISYQGETPSYEQVQNAHLAQGRFFTETEDAHRVDVAVLGYDLAETLFPAHDGLGKEILVDGVNYRVIGVIEKRKGVFLRDDTADKEVFVPYETYRKHRPQDKENWINVQFYPGMKAQAMDEITSVLRRRRHDDYNKPDSFSITSAEAITDRFRQIMGSIALLTIAVASVGLMVGGVGVMNIMLMSVTERTHEIGIRKAIGARRTDVVRQFLIEAIVLTGLGGVSGVLFSLALIFLAHVLAPSIPTAVPGWAIGVAVVASMSIGLFFGIYPAMKASKLDPVEALRYE